MTQTELIPVESARTPPRHRAPIITAIHGGATVLAVFPCGRRQPIHEVWPNHFPAPR